MSLQTTPTGHTDQLRQLFEASEEVTVINPSSKLLDTLVDLLLSSHSTLTVCADKAVLDDAMNHFWRRVETSGLIEDGQLSPYDSHIDSSTVALVEDKVYAVVSVQDTIYLSPITDEEIEAEISSRLNKLEMQATPYAFSTPSLSTLTDSFEEYITPEASNDFVAAFDAITDNTLKVDAVTLAIIVGAYHEALQYDISDWCVENHIASSATVSRRKRELVDASVIATEKEKQDVGRPRDRFVLSDELQDCDSIVTVLQQL